MSRPLRVLRSALSAAVVAVFAMGVVACQDDRAKIAGHMERGEAYAKESKHGEAIIELKNVLQIDPNHGPAHYALAKSYLASGKLREGFWELRETARLMPENLDAKLEFGQMARLAGEIDEALKQADEVIAADPNRAAAYGLRGVALESQKRVDEAKIAYEKAAEVGKDDADMLMLLAAFRERNQDRAGAEPLLKQIMELKPGFASAATYASFISRDPGRDAEAEAGFRRALEQAKPEELSVAYRSVASFLYSRSRFDDSEQTLRSGLEKVPGDLELIYSLARFYAARGDAAKADAMVEEATKAKPGDVDPYLVLSAYRGRKGDLQGALGAAEKALELKPDDRRARLRKAELLLDIGYRAGNKEQIAEGRGIAESVLALEPANPEALFVKAKIDLAERRWDEATSGLRRALESKPDWAQARFLLGSSLFFGGDRDGARAELVRALELDADLLDARKLLARVHASLGSDELAVEEGRKTLGVQDDPAIHVVVAQSLVRLNRADEALAELQKISEDARDAEAWYAIGRVHMIQRKTEPARRALERADQASPGNPEVLNSLLMLDRAEGKLDDSLARIERASNEKPDSAQLMHLLGLAHALSGKPTEAERSLRRAIELDPGALDVYQTLAQVFYASGRQAEMLSTYEKALAARPDSGQLHLVIGTLRELNGQLDMAEDHYAKALKYDPNLAVAKNNLAYLLAEQGRELDRALALAQEAKAAMPDSANTADTLGWVLLKKGVASAAIGYLREAEGLTKSGDASTGIIRIHLATAYEANGEADRARETLERALGEIQPGTPDPSWAKTARDMLQRVGGTAAPAPEAAPAEEGAAPPQG